MLIIIKKISRIYCINKKSNNKIENGSVKLKIVKGYFKNNQPIFVQYILFNIL